MDNDSVCIGGDGGPLIVLQASAVPQWQGATEFDNSLMGGGDIETDYDVICESVGADEFCVIPRYGLEMLVLWDSEFGGMVMPPHICSLDDDSIILTMCYQANYLPDIVPHIKQTIAEGKPKRSCLFHIKDTPLRLQVGADSGISYNYEYLDIPVSPGVKLCNVYLVKHGSLTDTIVVIGDPIQSPA